MSGIFAKVFRKNQPGYTIFLTSDDQEESYTKVEIGINDDERVPSVNELLDQYDDTILHWLYDSRLYAEISFPGKINEAMLRTMMHNVITAYNIMTPCSSSHVNDLRDLKFPDGTPVIKPESLIIDEITKCHTYFYPMKGAPAHDESVRSYRCAYIYSLSESCHDITINILSGFRKLSIELKSDYRITYTPAKGSKPITISMVYDIIRVIFKITGGGQAILLTNSNFIRYDDLIKHIRNSAVTPSAE